MARRDDELGNLGREKTLQAANAFDFGNLLGHPLFEGAVPCLKIGCLCRYSIVRLLQIGGALAQLIKQPRVLDSDDGLGSEIGYQLDLLVAEWLHLGAIDADRTDQLVFFEHRDGDVSPGTGRFEEGSAHRIAVVGRLGLSIGNLSRLFRCHHASEAGPGYGAYERVAPSLLDVRRRCIMVRGDAENAPFPEVQHAERGPAYRRAAGYVDSCMQPA